MANSARTSTRQARGTQAKPRVVHQSNQLAIDSDVFWTRIRRENRSRDLHFEVQAILNLAAEVQHLAAGFDPADDLDVDGSQTLGLIEDAAGDIAEVARKLDDLLDAEAA